jgi:hypothetical protein
MAEQLAKVGAIQICYETFGSADELPVKLEVVSALQSGDDDWTRLDVRDPDRPVYQ